MKEVIQMIKTLWQNRRYRAIVILIVYVLFFTFVFMFISAYKKPNIPAQPITGWDAFDKVEQYHYQLTIDETVCLNYPQNIVTYQDKNYTIDEMDGILESYHLTYWNPVNIHRLVSASTLISTNYIENKDTYQLLFTDFQTMVNWVDDNHNDFIIDVYKKEDMYYKVVIQRENFHLIWEIN